MRNYLLPALSKSLYYEIFLVSLQSEETETVIEFFGFRIPCLPFLLDSNCKHGGRESATAHYTEQAVCYAKKKSNQLYILGRNGTSYLDWDLTGTLVGDPPKIPQLEPNFFSCNKFTHPGLQKLLLDWPLD